jgi:hypothetical protein
MTKFSVVFDRPIIILACPRSGSTLLFETLKKATSLWSIGDESHAIIEHIPEFSTVYNGFKSNQLTEDDGDLRTISLLKSRFQSQLRNKHNVPYQQLQDGAVRFLEKTPKNSLRIRFLKKVFPDALFIHLIRDPKDNISSIIDGWQSKHFITYPNLPGFDNAWSYLLPPNWQSLQGKSIPQIASFQWASCNQTIHDELTKMPQDNYHVVNYQDFLDNTSEVVKRLCEFIGIVYDDDLKSYCEKALPYSRYTLTKPEKNKWLKHSVDLEEPLSKLSELTTALNSLSAPFTPYTINNKINSPIGTVN